MRSALIFCSVLWPVAALATNDNASANSVTNSAATNSTSSNSPATTLDTQTTVAGGMPRLQTGPVSDISAEQLTSINFTNVEDAVRDQPGIIVRKRYIGDPNATLGMRGSNMFQTARSLVFADGLPLHYHLQTRYSGAPRWSVVAPSEVDNVEILYGPFSAQYAGNAMGGVVNISTRLPDEQEIVLEGSAFMQDYDNLQRAQQLSGQKLFASYGNRIGNLQFLAGVQRLNNDGQPMSFYYSPEKSSAGTNVSGGVRGKDNKGNDVLLYGDSGVADTLTDLYKLRSRYALDNGELRASLVYEERQNNTTDARSYLSDDSGNTVYSGNVTQDGVNYSASASNFRSTEQQRNSLLAGFGASHELAAGWQASADISRFRILKDEQIRTAKNPADPAWDGSGDAQNFNHTGWETADIRFANPTLAADNIQLTLGYHYDHYQLATDKASVDFISGSVASAVPQSGGETRVQALFAETGWQFLPDFDLTAGLRYERFQGLNGFKGSDQNDDRHESAVSPKFSLGWTMNDQISSRYSIARAVRFPIVEELYENASNDDVQVIANALLAPERGIHHNLNIRWQTGDAGVDANLFYEKVSDTIFNQSGLYDDGSGSLVTISSFLNIPSVSTRGADISLFKNGLLTERLDARLNMTAIRARIDDNPALADSEGKDVPRIPRWSQNLTLTWHQTTAVAMSTSVRHISNSFNELDNSDHESNVFSAIDAYTFIDAKIRWQINRAAFTALGVDNLTNEIAYVHHPYPQRTVFIEGGYRF
ncbi:TonB-dependent receptor [Thalassolituus sp. LLYu03]|uniref:TonB-dependent receptor n=1 Tax=Thalassolituus sp. LLYu03 TaxID=3421656 RepID=UPI003D28E489